MLNLDASSQELNATGDKDFGCCGFDELYGYEPGDELAWHWHECFEAILCVEGAFKLLVANKAVTLRPGMAAFINAWRPHSATGEPKARIRSLTFDGKLVGGAPGSAIARRYVEPLKLASGCDLVVFRPSDAREKRYAWHLAEAIDALEAEEPGFEIAVRDHVSQALLSAWELTGAPAPVTPEDTVSAERTSLMCDHIVEHYAEKLTVGEIAASAGVSERECLRCFTKTFGVSPSRYLLMHRLSKATELLAGSDLPIAEVGRAVGIQSPSNFAQLFRRDYHCTPRMYRVRARGQGRGKGKI